MGRSLCVFVICIVVLLSRGKHLETQRTYEEWLLERMVKGFAYFLDVK